MAKSSRNPLRLDPSRTNLLSRQFAADIVRRFAALDKAVREWVMREGVTANFDPDQPRDEQGRWTDSFDNIKFPSGVHVKLHHNPSTKTTTLGLISVDFDKRKQGLGGMAMRQITKTADEHAVRLRLIAAPEDKGGLSEAGLEKWYAKYGFVVDPHDSRKMLRTPNHEPTTNAPYAFPTSPKKLKAFQTWLKAQVDAKILTVPKGFEKKPWTSKYVTSAWKKGALRAYTDARPELGKTPAWYAGSKAQFLETAFGGAERTGKIELLSTRTFETLKGISSQMSSQMTRVLADGMAHGKAPAEIARTMSKTITGLSRERARLIAQTEIMHSHAEGQLDGFEELGIDEVGAEVEFSTAGDDGVCEKCEDLEGETYTVDEARGVLPVHPRCRCAWIPAPIKIPD